MEMDESIRDIQFLASSENRTGVLDALLEQPLSRDELQTVTAASSPTMGRILGHFEDRNWIVRAGRRYELTPLGDYVANRYADLREAMGTERMLRDVWQWLPREMDGFSVELFADAVVSYPGPGYPYQPVERVTHLVEETNTMHTFGTTEFKSTNLAAVCDAVLDGMEYECIYPTAVLEQVVAWNPEQVAEAFARDNCTILLHESLPDDDRCGICLFDDRMGICCHDDETGLLEAVVDTAAPEAREWAKSVYREHRTEARAITPDDIADQIDRLA